jgi:hypothetical protein
MEKYIRVKDHGTVLEISYEDMIKYHGRFNIGGVALAFKSLELGLAKLLPAGEIPERSKISYASALGESATGVVDGVEMATRAVSRGALSTEVAFERDIDAPTNPDGGKFYFEITCDGAKIGLALKAGLIPEEFTGLLMIALSRHLTPGELQRLQEVKEEIAAALMSMEVENLFSIIFKSRRRNRIFNKPPFIFGRRFLIAIL